jgi:hypothetical protein
MLGSGQPFLDNLFDRTTTFRPAILRQPFLQVGSGQPFFSNLFARTTTRLVQASHSLATFLLGLPPAQFRPAICWQPSCWDYHPLDQVSNSVENFFVRTIVLLVQASHSLAILS